MNDDGAFIGLFVPLIYTDSLFDSSFKLVVELGKLPGFPAGSRTRNCHSSDGKHIRI